MRENEMEKCVGTCPIVQDLEPKEQVMILSDEVIALCGIKRVGLLGPLCGLPHGEVKNHITRHALCAARKDRLVNSR